MNIKNISSRSDGASTKQRILETAIELFAQHGLADTPNKLIAQQAEVDLASINYHFGNRTKLYQTALIFAHSKLLQLDALQSIELLDISAQEKLQKLIGYLCQNNIYAQKGYARLIAREVLAPSESLMLLFTQEVHPKIAILKHIVSQISGIPLNAPQLAPCLISVAAPCLMMLVAHPNLPGPFEQLSQLDRKYLSDHMYQFCLAGLEAAGKMYRENVS